MAENEDIIQEISVFSLYNADSEELLFLFISMLLERYGQAFETGISEYRAEIEAACLFMEQHYTEHISLEQLCTSSTLSKSTLLRAFIRSKGVTPYRYLQSIRVGNAKALLEGGVSQMESVLSALGITMGMKMPDVVGSDVTGKAEKRMRLPDICEFFYYLQWEYGMIKKSDNNSYRRDKRCFIIVRESFLILMELYFLTVTSTS